METMDRALFEGANRKFHYEGPTTFERKNFPSHPVDLKHLYIAVADTV